MTTTSAPEGPATAVRFRTWGTYVHVGTEEAAALPEAERCVRALLEEVDLACSRFRADSELTRVSAAAGRRVAAGPVLVAAVEAALDAARQTDGLVSPLLGRELVDLGYDRDFEDLRPVARRTGRPEPEAWRSLEVGPDWVRVPEGTSLDLGSVGKAWASDLAAASVAARVGCGAIVSLGGDIAIAGDSEWPIELRESPDAADPDEVVWLTGGGLATSSTQVRRWTQQGVARHHVLDPRTGLPAEVVWRTVTATGPTCVAANTAATAAIVLGAEAPRWLAERRVDARLVAADGTVWRLGAWPARDDAETAPGGSDR